MLPRLSARGGLHRSDRQCGKTTTKELIAAVLSSQLTGRKSRDTHNTVSQIARGLWTVRPWHDFYVQEIGASSSDDRVPFEVPLRMVRPKIGVVTNIGSDHISTYHTVEAIAAEKGKLIAALSPQDTAVLNADDPRVSAMQATCAGRVITYGRAPGATLRAIDIPSSWPELLSFTALYGDQSQVVRTQLCGEHMVSCVLAALAVGIAMGIPLSRAAQGVETMAPFKGRMSPVWRPGGIAFIRDDIKAPLWSIPASLLFMKEARARRRIVVIGSISDYTGNSNRRYVAVARRALAVADRVVFVGPNASKCRPGEIPRIARCTPSTPSRPPASTCAMSCSPGISCSSKASPAPAPGAGARRAPNRDPPDRRARTPG